MAIKYSLGYPNIALPGESVKATLMNAEAFGIVLILSPVSRILEDILADAVQIVLVADNVFVIIALP